MTVEPFMDNPANGGVQQSVPGSSEDGTSRSDFPGPGQNQRKGAALGAVNRGTNEAGLRPEAVTSEAGSSSGSRTVVETDAGALPPMYDQIESSRVADIPVRNGL
ncbi:hypothetical protein FRC07_011538 [Ceratobasidium sp. 392]|nr:hypothetical protein FRC07_011538 [Ceratobasidium sp. 392]